MEQSHLQQSFGTLFTALNKQCLAKQEKIVSPIYPICPSLHYNNKQKNSSFKSSYTEDESCISWSDTQNPDSVIYVSIGSIVRIAKSELLEMAWGLANSGQPLLWVVRPGLVDGSNGLELLPNAWVHENHKE